MSYVQEPMTLMDVRDTIERLHQSWMARYTREAHEVSGRYQWVVFHRGSDQEKPRMTTGVNAVFNVDHVTVATTAHRGVTIPVGDILEVHLKPCS